MHCIIVAGAPASGKSTYARQWVEAGYVEINRDNIRFSVIDPGGNWTTYKFNKKKEKEVTRIWFSRTLNAALMCRNIIISDTLCNKDKRQDVIDYCKDLGYTVDVLILNPSLEELVRRDKERGVFSVGEKVIELKYKELNYDLR